jgi:hypothetical protein
MKTGPFITDCISNVSSIGATIIARVAAYYTYKQYLQPSFQTPAPEAGQENDTETEPTILPVTKENSRIQWALSRQQFKKTLVAKDYSVGPGVKVCSRAFPVGSRRNWLYSKSLVSEPAYLHGALNDILKRASDD